MHTLPAVGGLVAPLLLAAPVAAHSLTVAAVQTPLRLYSDEAQFRAQMTEAVARAMQHSPDLIVFPEHVGTGLVTLDVGDADRLDSLPAVVGALLEDGGEGVQEMIAAGASAPRAILLVRSERMRSVYVGVFSELAQMNDVHIVAGSILLPHEDARDGAVHNTSLLFAPDGAVDGGVDKVNLIPVEAADGLDIVPGDPGQVGPWETAIGTLAPLICLDAWDTRLAASLVERGGQMLVVPSANPEPWTAEELAERKQGMFARVRELGVPGVEAFAVGSLAGVPFEGRSWILAPDAEAPEGVRILAQADSPTEPQVIAATVELLAR